MTPHKDIAGNPIEVGSRVVFVGADPEDAEYRGMQAWVRQTTPGRDRSIAIDNGDEQDIDICTSKSWNWASWVNPSDLMVVTAP